MGVGLDIGVDGAMDLFVLLEVREMKRVFSTDKLWTEQKQTKEVNFCCHLGLSPYPTFRLPDQTNAQSLTIVAYLALCLGPSLFIFSLPKPSNYL